MLRGRIKPGVSVQHVTTPAGWPTSFGRWPFSRDFFYSKLEKDLPPIDTIFDFELCYIEYRRDPVIKATAPGYGASNDFGKGGFIIRLDYV